MSVDDQALEVLLESARLAFRDTAREDSNYQFSEKDFLELIRDIWQDRFKSEQLTFKAKCTELLLREGIDENK